MFICNQSNGQSHTQNNSKGIINIIKKYTINFLAHTLHYVLNKDNRISIVVKYNF